MKVHLCLFLSICQRVFNFNGLPVMNGVEFIRCLREAPETARIPVVAASGDTHLVGAADAVVPSTRRLWADESSTST